MISPRIFISFGESVAAGISAALINQDAKTEPAGPEFSKNTNRTPTLENQYQTYSSQHSSPIIHPDPFCHRGHCVCETPTIAYSLGTAGAQASVVGFGTNWSYFSISCLADDPTGIIPTTGFYPRSGC